MERKPVESSQLKSVGYDENTQTLEIEFHYRGLTPGVQGSVYRYANVTPEVHEALINAESIGSHFINHIKPHPQKYPYTKIQ